VGRSRVSAQILMFISVVALGGAAHGQRSAAGGAAGPGTQAPGAEAAQGLAGLAPAAGLEGMVDSESYVLGVGDALGIGFWGEANREETVYVNPDGDILLPPVGPVRVDGLTLGEARDLIVESLSPYYTPSILSVSLVGVRTFQVHVVGMVGAPGAYEANAVTRVSQAVAEAGSLHVNASLRNIEVRRGRETLRADLARYLLIGDKSANPFLRGGDVVYVPPERGDVHIFGSVYREGNYEYSEGETLAGLVELAGGFRPEAITDSLEIERFSAIDPTQWTRFFLHGDAGTLESFVLALDDYIFVRAVPDWHRDAHVSIVGEVVYPGVYVVEEGVEVLSELIERAGGFTEDASLAEAYLVRGMYEGRDLPPEKELAALVDAQEQMDWKEKDLFKTLSREPKGAESISLAAIYAGGGPGADPPLYNGDIVRVPRAGNVIRVMGQVHNPGLVPYVEGQYGGYYIHEAGGYASRADKRGTRVIRGQWGQKLKTGDSPVRPGDIVWVPEKKERGGWETFRDVVGVFAQIATVFLVIDAATK
jgi:protein involved in polysaccharide export with SLBB domain